MLDFHTSLSSSTILPQESWLRPLQQTPEFQRALSACGQATTVLPELNHTLVTKRRFWGGVELAMINRAPLSCPRHLTEALHANGLSRTPFILSPDRPTPNLGTIGALPLICPASTAVLDLTKSRPQRLAGLHQKWRNRLNRARENQLRVSRQNMPLDANHWLFSADLAQQQQRGYRSWPIGLTLAYAKANPGQAKLFQAFEGKEPLAAILILRHGNTATYHISHSTQRGKQLSAHNLLIWEASNWLVSKGCLQLDLGLINTEEAPGLARFKLGTGARLVKLGGTWALWPPLGKLLTPLARLDAKRMSARSH
ncbi:GNAT family N-acetyltransferase [Pseudophaeobacter sp.]|uniref:GNAT family N-acetyltransferase n=1 Tax=Pseudophaeobacter sp. TaxID=1971739 RepID=UPI003299A850